MMKLILGGKILFKNIVTRIVFAISIFMFRTLYIREEKENTSTRIREKNNYRVDKKTTS